MKTYATYLLCAVMTAASLPVAAQTVPPGQSCGGLLCDMGVFGHKVPTNADGTPPTQQQVATAEAAAEVADPHRLPCHDFVCGMFQKRETAAAPVSEPVAEVAPAVPEKHVRKVKHKRVAKADAAEPTAAK